MYFRSVVSQLTTNITRVVSRDIRVKLPSCSNVSVNGYDVAGARRTRLRVEWRRDAFR